MGLSTETKGSDMAAEADELDKLLADIARNIAENRRFVQNLLDEQPGDGLDEADEVNDNGVVEEFEEL